MQAVGTIAEGCLEPLEPQVEPPRWFHNESRVSPELPGFFHFARMVEPLEPRFAHIRGRVREESGERDGKRQGVA